MPFAEYQRRVLGYLGSRDPIRVQRCTPSALERRLRGLPRALVRRRPEPTRWSIAEIVAHVADAELAMGWRLRSMNHLRQIDRILAADRRRRSAVRGAATERRPRG